MERQYNTVRLHHRIVIACVAPVLEHMRVSPLVTAHCEAVQLMELRVMRERGRASGAGEGGGSQGGRGLWVAGTITCRRNTMLFTSGVVRLPDVTVTRSAKVSAFPAVVSTDPLSWIQVHQQVCLSSGLQRSTTDRTRSLLSTERAFGP